MGFDKCTKDELIKEINRLNKKVNKLEASAIPRLQKQKFQKSPNTRKQNNIKESLRKISHALGERGKELSCLYSISNILNESIPPEKAFHKILKVIIQSYQYPEITAARLLMNESEYKTNKFEKTKWVQSCSIYANKKKIGELEVVYLEKRPDAFEGPFLKEERHLINSIAQLLTQFVVRKQTELELQESREQLKNFAAHLQTIREEERVYISRELHDNLGQSLTALKIDLFRILKKLSDEKENSNLNYVIDQTQEMVHLVDSIIQSVRTIARELRPRVLDDLGLLSAVEWQIKEFVKRSGIKCQLISSLNNIDINKVHSIGIFRIIQESLTNVIRHSDATNVIIKIYEKTDKTLIEIEDNGCGIKQSDIFSSKSLGLLGMRERALIFGGDFIIKGTEGKGTKILLTIPKI
jgi:signal transduction histidine kinase